MIQNLFPKILSVVVLLHNSSSLLRYTDRSPIFRQPIENLFSDKSIALPTSCGSWTPVDKMKLTCPSQEQASPEAQLTYQLGGVYHPNPSNGLMVSGHLCLKQRWVSTCVETWYFSTTETNKIEDEVITEEECKNGIAAYKSGEYLNPFFPPFYCSWASTQVNGKTFILIEEHQVSENVYNYTFQDPLFLNGYCRSEICKTIHPETLWVAENPLNRWDVCNKHNWEKGVLHGLIEEDDEPSGDRFSIDQHWIRSSLYGSRNLEGSCRRPVCGSPGIRFKTGEWWGVDDRKLLGFMYQRLPMCKPSDKISFHHDNRDETILEEQYVVRQMLCAELIGKIMVNEHISPMDLSLLIPTNPGKGPAYKIYKQVLNKGHHGGAEIEYHLRTAQCNYHIIHNTSKVYNIAGGNVVLGSWFTGKEYKLNTSDNFSVPVDLHKDNKSRDGWFFYSFNGYTKIGNNLYSPDYVLEGPIGFLNYTQKGILFLEDPPEINSVKGQMDLYNTVYKSEFKTNTTNVGEKITNFVKSAKDAISSYFSQLSSIAWWIITGVISVIILFIAKKFGLISYIKRLICKKKQREPTQDLKPPEKHIYETVKPHSPRGKSSRGSDSTASFFEF